MSPYVCDCTNVVYMFCVYCIYYYVNKFEARSLFSTSHLYAKACIDVKFVVFFCMPLLFKFFNVKLCDAIKQVYKIELVRCKT